MAAVSNRTKILIWRQITTQFLEFWNIHGELFDNWFLITIFAYTEGIARSCPARKHTGKRRGSAFLRYSSLMKCRAVSNKTKILNWKQIIPIWKGGYETNVDGAAGKKTLRYVLASVRPVKGSQPVALRQSGLDSRCHIPTWGSSCLRAVIISLHVAPSPPRCWHAWLLRSVRTSSQIYNFKIEWQMNNTEDPCIWSSFQWS